MQVKRRTNSVMRRASLRLLVFTLTVVVLINIDWPWLKTDRYGMCPDIRISPVTFPCLGSGPGQSEDLFCLYRKKLLADYKNPCWRDNDGSIRCLPYFHLIGSDKCGSTDLFNRITHHPEVENCKCVNGKESSYWCWRRYGDGTPMDFWDFRGWKTIPQNSGLSEPLVLTPHLMRHVYGNMKFLLIFRNPVDRLYSDYYFLRYGNSSESFHRDAIASVNMMMDCFRSMSVRACFYSDEMYRKLPTRIHLGCYSVFLKEWLSVFPCKSFLFLRTEDFGANIAGTLKTVFRFLNISDPDLDTMNDIASFKRKYVTERKKKAKPMMEATRRILNDFYHKYNVELADILKDDRFLWQS